MSHFAAMERGQASDILITGGGPAGMMAALLFARAGLGVRVLEKHADFLRDFRGDTVHPSTMEILAQLGLLDAFLQRPHNRVFAAEIDFNGRKLAVGDLTRLATPAPFIAMMPQWEFLDFLRVEAARYPGFALEMEARADALVEERGRVAGVRLADGSERRARLVIAADGRDSLVRRLGLLPLQDLGAPIDVFWFAVPKASAGNSLRGQISGSAMLVMIDRGAYWQCAFILGKGKADVIRAEGIAAFRQRIAAMAPELTGLDQALPDFEAVRLLSVSLNRLTTWHRPGLLAIGDAAHAMSPVGGVGINLAIQDAVCAANVLAAPMRAGADPDPLLERVQRRRMLPTRLVQAAQRQAHERVLKPLLAGEAKADGKPPLLLRLLDRYPLLRRLPGRMIGLGIHRERVQSPAAPG